MTSSKQLFLILTFAIYCSLYSHGTLFGQTIEPLCGMSQETQGSLPGMSKSNNVLMMAPGITSRIPTTGTVRALVIFVRFQDTVFQASGCHNDPDGGWPHTQFGLPNWANNFIDDIASPPYTEGSLSDFFYQMSDGTFNLIGDIHFYQAANNFSFYNVAGGRGILNQEALNALDQTANLNYADYDADSDGEVDLILFVYRFWGGFPTDPFAGFSGSGVANLGFTGSITLDGKTILGGGTGGFGLGSGVSMHNSTNLGFARRLAAHETGHHLYGGGHFDHMGSWGIFDAVDFIAMSAYEKVAIGWVAPTVISSSIQNLVIQDANTTNKYYRIDINSTDYFLLENRQALSVYEQFEFCNNGALPGTGLMISHITPTGTNKASHLRWEPADNTFGIGSSGESTDTYKPGNKIQFTPWTRPNSNDGSSATGIAVTNIRQSGNDIIVDIDLDFNGGDITEDSWWDGSLTIDQTVVVENNAILTVNQGTTVNFDPGAGLITNATLTVDGAQASPVTFDRSGATGSWDGITFNPGSSGIIKDAIIDHVNNGDGINIQSASPTIQNTTIRNCLWGLNLNTSNAVIQNCIIDNSDAGVFDRYGAAQYLDNTVMNSFGALTDGDGFSFASASPGLFRNVVDGNVTGVTGTGAALAAFGGNNLTGNNVVRNNGVGLRASGANTFLWLGETGNFGGDNSVYSNTVLDAQGLSSGWVWAESTWWGSPSGGNVSGNVIDDNPLSSDPNQGAGPAPALAGELQVTGNPAEGSGPSPIFDLLKQRHLHRTGKLPGFMNMLRGVANSKSGTALGKVAKGLLAVEHYLDGQYDDALATARESKAEVAGTDLEALALLVLFDAHLYGKGDASSAGVVLAELKGKYADVGLAKRLQFELDRGVSSKTQQLSASQISFQDKGALFADTPRNENQLSNHPNPFNPETRIQYQLPEAGFVQVKIYNLVGQEISTLVQEQKGSGAYSVVWDGRDDSGIQVGSGVYIYQITVQPSSPDARPFRQNGKMLLVR